MTALRRLGTARTGGNFSTALVVGALIRVVLLHDALTPALGVAAILMTIGVWLHVTELREHAHTHEAA